MEEVMTNNPAERTALLHGDDGTYAVWTEACMLAHGGDDDPVFMMALDVADKPLHVSPEAHQQIAHRLMLPRSYYVRMLERAPGLLVENVNYWWHTEPEWRLMTLRNGTVTGWDLMVTERDHTPAVEGL
jgi:hypothetical protein